MLHCSMPADDEKHGMERDAGTGQEAACQKGAQSARGRTVRSYSLTFVSRSRVGSRPGTKYGKSSPQIMFRRPLFAAAALAGTAGASALAFSQQSSDKLYSSRITGKELAGTTRWLKLETLSYVDQTGKARKWDMATRTTKREGSSADAVAILALLRSADNADYVETLVVQQFRPPVNAVTVELPAGLIDAGESAEVAALREL